MGLRTGLRILRLLGWKSDSTLLPMVCPLLISREIEFLKKETAQRRVLEESELARKEEMDKLLDKVGSGCPEGRGLWRVQQRSPPFSPLSLHPGGREGVMLLAQGHVPLRWGQKGQGPCLVSRPDPLSLLFARSQNWKETCKH